MARKTVRQWRDEPALSGRQRVAWNRDGLLVLLVGDPLPDGELPPDMQAMMARAEAEWFLGRDATWERVDQAEVENHRPCG